MTTGFILITGSWLIYLCLTFSIPHGHKCRPFSVKALFRLTNDKSYKINGTINIRQKLYGLDHLRALATVFAFLFHYFILSGGQPEWLPDFSRFGADRG